MPFTAHNRPSRNLAKYGTIGWFGRADARATQREVVVVGRGKDASVTDLSADRAAHGVEAGKRTGSKLRRYLRMQRLVLHLRLGPAQVLQHCIPYSLFGN